MDKNIKTKAYGCLGKVNVNYAEGACLVEAKLMLACIIERNFILRDWKENHGIDFADESVLRKHYEFSEKF